MKLLTHSPTVLNEEEMEQIFQAAQRVWARVPLRAQGPEAFMQPVRDLGCRIEGDKIYFPESVRDTVLQAIAEQRARNGPPQPAEVHTDTLEKMTSGQALYCCDLETEKLRPATQQDLALFSWIVDGIPHLGRAHPTFIPQDVPASCRDLFTFGLIALNSKRLWRVSVYNAEMIPYFLEIQAICEGDYEQARTHPVFATKCWANTPFMLTRENIEIGLKAREILGQPFQFATMPVAGIATPVTLAGALTLITAECLALNTLSLALDGRLCGWTAAPLTFDMRTGIHAENGPDVALLRLGSAQMGAYVFGGMWRAVGGPTTSSKQPDIQAIMDKALETMWAICGGVRSFGSLATLADADVGSITQLIIDLELMSYFERLLQGIHVEAETIAEELIIQIAPQGAYFLNQEHTARHFRPELWLPELLDRRVPMAWAQEPRVMLDNARAKAKKLAATAENQCPLSDEQKRQIKAVMAEAQARFSGRED